MTSLFDSLRLGALDLPNRILMAAMTRARGTRKHVPTEMMVEYYRQRASAGLIISEAIGVSQQGRGWPYATGIWSDEQAAASRGDSRSIQRRADSQLGLRFCPGASAIGSRTRRCDCIWTSVYWQPGSAAEIRSAVATGGKRDEYLVQPR